jgi:hypothetical protein
MREYCITTTQLQCSSLVRREERERERAGEATDLYERESQFTVVTRENQATPPTHGLATPD